jgi:hypothetical protein
VSEDVRGGEDKVDWGVHCRNLDAACVPLYVERPAHRSQLLDHEGCLEALIKKESDVRGYNQNANGERTFAVNRNRLMQEVEGIM